MTKTYRPVVAATTSTFAVSSDAPIRLLKDAGFTYRPNPYGRKLTPTETIETLQGAVGIIAGTESLNRHVLSALPKLRAIARCGAGMDNVDMDAAREKGIHVSNTPFGPTRSTAEFTVALLMALLRQIPAMDKDIRSGKWEKRTGRLIQNKHVGIIGYGRIGQAVAQILHVLGCKIRFYDPLASVDSEADAGRMSLEELLQWSEVITLHASEPKDGRFLLGKKEIGQMRPGAWLLNCARGSLVDEAALAQALRDGHLNGAALDTYMTEPYSGPLIGMDNIILTPHVGSYALEGRQKMEMDAAQNLINALTGLDLA